VNPANRRRKVGFFASPSAKLCGLFPLLCLNLLYANSTAHCAILFSGIGRVAQTNAFLRQSSGAPGKSTNFIFIVLLA
jgi:hypothetical protein